MAKFSSQKSSFLGGELGSTALGRTDLPQYQSGCQTMRNMIPLLSGGAYRRPGSLFVESYALSGNHAAPRLFPFVYSSSESYCLSFFGAGYGSSAGTARYITSDLASKGDITGTHPYLIGSVSTNYDELWQVDYTQSADILYLVHSKYKPRRVTRSAANTFAFSLFDDGLTSTTFRDAWPYRSQNTTSITLACSNTAIGTGRTLTASAALFQTTHVGAVFKINHSGAPTVFGCVKVTAYTSSTSVTVDVVETLSSTGATLLWWESAWSDYRGWPQTVGFFYQRLVYAGNTAQPDTFWFSKQNNFNKLSVAASVDPFSEVDDVEAFSLTLSSQQVNIIQWMSPEQTLVAGTTGGEWVIEPDSTGTFSGTKRIATNRTHYGSAQVKAVREGNEVLFVDLAGTEVKALIFNLVQNAYSAEPVQSLFTDYPKGQILTEPGKRRIKEVVWDETRKCLWCTDSMGNFFSMTRDRNLQLSMWASHQMGGYDDSVSPDSVAASVDNRFDPIYFAPTGSVVSLAVVPSSTYGFNNIFLVTSRYINGAWTFHLEVMRGGPFSLTSAYDLELSGNIIFTDDSAYCTPIPTPTVSAAHLEGESLEGTIFSTRGIFSASTSAVTAGSAAITSTIPTVASYQIVSAFGFPYDAYIIPTRIDAGSQIGTAQGAVKRIHEVMVRVARTLALKVGRDTDNLEQIIFRQGDTPMGYSPELYTGDKRILVDCDYDTDQDLIFLSDKPLPFTLVSYAAFGQTYDQ